MRPTRRGSLGQRAQRRDDVVGASRRAPPTRRRSRSCRRRCRAPRAAPSAQTSLRCSSQRVDERRRRAASRARTRRRRPRSSRRPRGVALVEHDERAAVDLEVPRATRPRRRGAAPPGVAPRCSDAPARVEAGGERRRRRRRAAPRPRRAPVHDERRLGDDAERALGPDEELREVRPDGRRGAPPADVHDLAVGEHDGEAAHDVLDLAVAVGVLARAAAGQPPADGGELEGLGEVADGQAGGARRGLELGPEAAGLGRRPVRTRRRRRATRAQRGQVEGDAPAGAAAPPTTPERPPWATTATPTRARDAQHAGHLRGAGRPSHERRPARDAPGVGVEQDGPATSRARRRRGPGGPGRPRRPGRAARARAWRRRRARPRGPRRRARPGARAGSRDLAEPRGGELALDERAVGADLAVALLAGPPELVGHAARRRPAPRPARRARPGGGRGSAGTAGRRATSPSRRARRRRTRRRGRAGPSIAGAPSRGSRRRGRAPRARPGRSAA